MADFDNTNRFALFKNDRKRDDKDADYTGSVNIDGTEYWLNGWVKEGQKGKFFSGTIRPKQQAAQRQSPPQKRPDPISTGRPRNDDPMDDSVPFFMEWR